MADYIEKEAAKEAILSWAVCINHPELLSKEDTMHCIDNLPAADVAPVRHGEWIEYETSSYAGTDDFGEPKWVPKKFFRCSICRKGTAVRSHFCPNCGADMREVDNETD